MSRGVYRRSTPKVVDGKVQTKNRTGRTLNYFNTAQNSPVIDRFRPGLGYRHILKKKDIERFLELLPDWSVLSTGLRAVIMAPGSSTAQGWHRHGIVAVCAWDRELWGEYETDWVDDHRRVFEMIELECEKVDYQTTLCKWTEAKIRAFQLVHILLHELGHHHDRMTTRSRRRPCRGEPYAEAYALRYADTIWDRYTAEFGLP